MEKTNIKLLENILDELKREEFGEDEFNKQIEEAKEFLEAIGDELKDLETERDDAKDEVKNSETKINELESEIAEYEESPSSEEYNVGLDTIHIGYDNGNMKIQQQVENFMEGLQKENGVVPS